MDPRYPGETDGKFIRRLNQLVREGHKDEAKEIARQHFKGENLREIIMAFNAIDAARRHSPDIA